MAFNKETFSIVSSGFNTGTSKIFSYSTTDSKATVLASGYFTADVNIVKISVGDVISVNYDTDGTPEVMLVWCNSNDGTTVTVKQVISEGDIVLDNGEIFVGNASSEAIGVLMSGDATISNTGVLTIANDAITSGKIATGAVQASDIADGGATAILIGSGTVPSWQTPSGDWIFTTAAGDNQINNNAITTAKINDNAVTLDKMAGLASANFILGNGSGDPAAVTMSGDASMSNAGVVTLANDAVETINIQDGAVTNVKVSDKTLTGGKAATLADAATTPGLPVVYMIDTAGGATADTDVVIDNKTRVLRVDVVLRGAGTPSDTLTVKNGSNAITDAIAISGADTSFVSCSNIDDANWEIAGGGTLKITETDGSGNDSPPTTVLVYGVLVA